MKMGMGCGTFVICFIITTILCGLAQGTDATGLVVCLGTIAMLVLPFVVGSYSNRKQREEEEKYNYSRLSTSIDRNDETKTLTYNNNRGVFTYMLNATRRRIDYIDHEGKKSIDIDHVIDCKVMKDTEVIQSTSSGKTVMGAIIAGVPGAIIGHAMSSPQTRTEVKDYYIRFILDTPLEPIQNMIFIGHGVSAPIREAQEVAEEIFAFALASMSRRNSETNAQENKKIIKEKELKKTEEYLSAPMTEKDSSMECPPASKPESILEKVRKLNNVAEIYDFLSQTLEDNVDSREFLKQLNFMVFVSKAQGDKFGHNKKHAIMLTESFFKHGKRVFFVDKYDEELECPVCGKSQTSEQTYCIRCKALFRD